MGSEPAAVNGHQEPPATYRQVADELRARIRAGRLRPGERLPTQARLADEFGVERAAVRQALRVLRSEHLLADVSKGAPATVAQHTGPVFTGPGAPPQPTMVGLGPRVTAAFGARHVQIDALCLTAVSLTLAMGEPLRQIHAGRSNPAKVDVRVLLPSRDIDLAFPTRVGTADARLQRNWLAQRNAQGQVLRHNLLALRSTHGIDVHVTFRALPFTPPIKLYLLNGGEALFAYYTLTRRDEQIDQEYLETYGVQGTRSMLFPFEQGQGQGLRETTFVEQSHLWFDSLWNTISSDLTLTP
ncbi:winged helix-turn-helix domain-containing protein [Streptomyces sp. CB01635]|uniref:winged helix-turn-helix domain-containing protein n=1 Tax=unclassified Streptomyces TaxID=2593676 RepID=UPI001F23A1D6|nr:winged helix-turn-helix domain-containing protein [Streptomyces sp. CB01635]